MSKSFNFQDLLIFAGTLIFVIVLLIGAVIRIKNKFERKNERKKNRNKVKPCFDNSSQEENNCSLTGEDPDDDDDDCKWTGSACIGKKYDRFGYRIVEPS